jgi:hypothetical protein
MINPRVLSAAAVMAVVLPMAAPTASFAQNHAGRAVAVGGGGAPAARFGGGNGAFHPGGVSAPAAQFHAAGAGFRPGGVSAPVAQFNGAGAGYRGAGVSPPAVAQYNGGPYRGGYGGFHHRDHDRDRGFIPGVVAGAVVGGALAADSYAYYGGPAYYGPGYYDDQYSDDSAVVAATPAPGGDDAVAYCMQTYRSYDPASGTYLGNDGLRHPCP